MNEKEQVGRDQLHKAQQDLVEVEKSLDDKGVEMTEALAKQNADKKVLMDAIAQYRKMVLHLK